MSIPEGIPVGSHECKTCPRCACTFAAVHPVCPRCAEAARCAESESYDPDMRGDDPRDRF